MQNTDRVYQLVYIPDEQAIGIVVDEGPYVSTVQFDKDGTRYEVLLDNTEFIVRQEISVRIEEE